MIKRIIFYSCFIFFYHLLLLVLPINFFLISLRIPFMLHAFPWLFYPFLISSPILTLLFAFRATPANSGRFGWIFPVAISLIGCSPLISYYFLIASLSNIRNYALVFSFPIALGLIAFSGSRFLKFSRPNNPKASL